MQRVTANNIDAVPLMYIYYIHNEDIILRLVKGSNSTVYNIEYFTAYNPDVICIESIVQ
jgi:hypothetical protein